MLRIGHRSRQRLGDLVHDLNNDTQHDDGTYSDDGEGWGIAEGLEKGTHVEAGQVIGWVGDSGNAE